MIENEVKKQWCEIWRNSSAPIEKVEFFWDMVYRSYNAKGRFYHSLTHIEQMLHSCFLHKDKIEDLQNVKLAIFYHDIIYSAKRSDNELKSSILAAKHLTELNCLPDRIDKCCSYILSTKGHNSPVSENDLNFFLDFDLEKLGSSPAEYFIYTQKIRKEYSFYPDLIYNSGRRKVLEHFLNFKRIFRTEEFYKAYEEQARENIINELNSLN